MSLSLGETILVDIIYKLGSNYQVKMDVYNIISVTFLSFAHISVRECSFCLKDISVGAVLALQT